MDGQTGSSDDAAAGPSCSSTSSISAEEKRAERMKRLRELHLRRVRCMVIKEDRAVGAAHKMRLMSEDGT